MCVVLIADTVRPSEDMVAKSWKANSDGAGVAWREGGYVHWAKGLGEAEMQKFCRELPTPFIAHFRIASVGGVRDVLTHPFPISKDVSLELRGKTKDYVLFHNGTWHNWRTSLLDSIKGTNWKVPSGKWSDARALAWMAAHYDIGVLEMINEKVAAFGPEKGQLEVFGKAGGQDGWSLIEGVWASNGYFQRFQTSTKVYTGTSPYTTPPASLPGGSKKEEVVSVVEIVTPKAQTGGSATENFFDQRKWQEIPLAEAQVLWQAGKLSNKKFKKVLKKYNQAPPLRLVKS